MYLITTIGILFFIKHETPKFLVIKKDYPKALAAIRAIYDKDQDPEEVLQFLKKNIQKNTGNVTFKEALVNPLYRKATWVVLGLNFFN